MSAASLKVVVLAVLLGDARPAVTDALVATLHEVLGADVTVRVEERAGFDDGPALPADTVEARLAWDASGIVALLHVHGLPEQIDRSVTFSPEDDPAERGRTLGFVVAAILPLPLAPPEVRPPPPGPRPPTAGARVTAVVERSPVASLALAGQASLGAFDDGATTALGGGLGVGWLASRSLVLGLRAEARFGQIDDAQATTRWLGAKASASWTFLELATPRLLSLGIRGGVGLARESVTHFSSDDPAPIEQGRWAGVADLGLEVCLWARPTVGLLLALGTDVVFGRLDLVIEDDRVATLALVRPMVALGVRTDL